MNKLYTTLFLALIASFSLTAQDEFYNDGADVTVENNAEVHIKGNLKNKGNGTNNSTANIDNNGKIVLNATSNGSANGNLRNDGANGTDKAIIKNDGLIDLQTGDYYQNGDAEYDINNSSGTIRFSGGPSAQIAENTSGGSLNFNNVEVDNGRSFSPPNWIGGLELKSDITVDNKIDLKITNNNATNSKIFTNGNLITLNNSSTSAIENVSAGTRYIQLKGDYPATNEGLKWRIADASQNSYEFPIGTREEDYTGVTLNFTQNTPSGQYITARFKEMNDPGTFGPTSGFSNNPWFSHIVQCSGDDQWVELDRMIKDYGIWDIEPSGGSNWNYNITVEADARAESSSNDQNDPDFQETGTYSVFKLIKTNEPIGNIDASYEWNDDVWNSGDMCEFMTVAQGDTIGGNPSVQGLQASNVKGFSRFGIAGFQNGSGQPVELINLEAHGVDNEYITVNWATATEVNNDGFEVHRRKKGTEFQKIGWVDGNGSTQEKQTYNFDDYNVEHNTVYYYRLKQIDFNGNFEKTQVVTAMIEDGNVFTISDFIPNPSTEDSKLMVSTSEKKELNIKLYNTLGQVVNDKDVTVQSGSTAIDFSLDNVADGTYHAVISVDNEVFNRKLVITKD